MLVDGWLEFCLVFLGCCKPDFDTCSMLLKSFVRMTGLPKKTVDCMLKSRLCHVTVL